MRCKKEKIILDATVRFMVKEHIFAVELENGHRMNAIVKGCPSGNQSEDSGLKEGSRVYVETTPCDMLFGRIISKEPEEMKK